MNDHLRKLSEDRKNAKEQFRPSSACIKNPNIYNSNKTKGNFPNLFTNKKALNENTKKFPNTISEKEKFYDENINLKTIINSIIKDNSIYKSEIHKLELEHNRKDKTLDEINNFINSSMKSGGKNDREVQLKIKETYLINSLKKELKELQNMSKCKTADIENMKNLIKSSKFNELNEEIMNINAEFLRTKNRFEVSIKENNDKEFYIKEYKQLQEAFAVQQSQLFQLNNDIKSKEHNSNSREEEMNYIKNFIKEKETYINKINKKFKIQKQINENKNKEHKSIDLEGLKSIIANCESKIPGMQIELTNFKKESENKDRKIKDLENLLKSNPESKDNYHKSHKFIKENIKFIENNPEDNQDSMGLFLKSKFQEILKEKDKLQIINKNLLEKLNNIEKNDNNYIESKQLKVKTDDVNNNINNLILDNKNNKIETKDDIIIENLDLKQENDKPKNNEEEEETKNFLFDEDQIKEFTYILIKNFEAKKLDISKLKAIFDEVDQNAEEIILNDFALKISKVLNV